MAAARLLSVLCRRAQGAPARKSFTKPAFFRFWSCQGVMGRDRGVRYHAQRNSTCMLERFGAHLEQILAGARWCRHGAIESAVVRCASNAHQRLQLRSWLQHIRSNFPNLCSCMMWVVCLWVLWGGVGWGGRGALPEVMFNSTAVPIRHKASLCSPQSPGRITAPRRRKGHTQRKHTRATAGLSPRHPDPAACTKRYSTTLHCCTATTQQTHLQVPSKLIRPNASASAPNNPPTPAAMHATQLLLPPRTSKQPNNNALRHTTL
jgi:hypothetical protein